MNLRTRYMGLELEHPIVASASPLSEKAETIQQMEEAGAAAVVMYSLFEEQLSGQPSDSRPAPEAYPGSPDAYLETLRKAAEATDIPIIASLNGITEAGWIDYAARMEQAGASAIELNIYYIPGDLTLSGRDVEQRYLDVTRAVKKTVSVPVAIKLNPYFSAPGHMAEALAEAGADGLVLFNRFYQPDFDIEELDVQPTLQLSMNSEIRLPLLWIAILYGRTDASLAASSGVQSSVEVVKYLLAGADVVMSTSALLRNGVSYLGSLRDGLSEWMEQKEYGSLDELRGTMSQLHIADPTAYERANYINTLERFVVA